MVGWAGGRGGRQEQAPTPEKLGGAPGASGRVRRRRQSEEFSGEAIGRTTSPAIEDKGRRWGPWILSVLW